MEKVYGKTATYECANPNCRVAFVARTADRARGWARSCSKPCASVVRVQESPKANIFSSEKKTEKMSTQKVDLDAMTFEQFKARMLTKLKEFEDHSWKQEDMRAFMKGEETVPLGDWFEWFRCQANLM